MSPRFRHTLFAAAASLAVALTGCASGAAPPVTTSSATRPPPTTEPRTPAPTVSTPGAATLRPTASSTATVRPTASSTATVRPTTSPTATIRPTTSPSTPSSTRTTTTAACTLPSELLGQDLERIPTARRIVALTFDAGASNAGVASILATLSKQGVPGTFFLTGDFVDAYPSSARAMAAYPLGNHTYHHPDLTTLSDSGVRAEIRSARSRIKTVTGQDPRPYFRFPFGAVDSRVIRIVNSECSVPFRWTVDTLGWKGTSGGQSVSTVVNRVLAAATPGEIVLMHVGAHPEDGSTLDADALPRVINGLRARGYTFVTLDAVLPAAP